MAAGVSGARPSSRTTPATNWCTLLAVQRSSKGRSGYEALVVEPKAPRPPRYVNEAKIWRSRPWARTPTTDTDRVLARYTSILNPAGPTAMDLRRTLRPIERGFGLFHQIEKSVEGDPPVCCLAQFVERTALADSIPRADIF